MNKFLKTIIWGVGIISLVIVIILNLTTYSYIKINEMVTTYTNNILIIISLAILIAIIFSICKIIKFCLKNVRKKYLIFGLFILLYVIIQIVWINAREAYPACDQDTAYQLAVAMKENRVEDYVKNSCTYGSELSNTIYLERYNQQFTLSFIWSLLFRILNSTDVLIIQYFNILCNALLGIIIFLICKELSTKYKINKYLAMFLYFTFLSIPLLSTFIYGDLSGMAFAMLGVYLLMKYTRKRKIRYAVYASISTALAYMFRMNILIFIIAMVIYLILDLLSKKENAKNIITKIIVIIGFCVISMLPSTLTKIYYCKKCGLDVNKTFPATGYFLMGTNTHSYAPGWYNYSIVEKSFKDLEKSKVEYKEDLKERTKYLINNPTYTLALYTEKNSSMWAETTFEAVRYNVSSTFGKNRFKNIELDYFLKNCNDFILIYQKALVLIIFIFSAIVIIQKRKDLSNEVILLLTIFIGGFLFHNIWEAKSRYIIPYIIALIPIASIEIEKIKVTIKKDKKKM